MRILQTYYTSCEVGLSGAVGYQFNAISPGVTDQFQREVEAVSLYDPPDRVGGRPSEEAIAEAPISLVFRPGEPNILAQLRYVGADFSGRYGNFFSHALILSDAPAYPVELWGSPVWVSTPSPVTEVAPLKSLPAAGPVHRQSVAARLGSASDRLAKLITAVDLTLNNDERRVVLVNQEAGDNAYWIAAASYLLPPTTTSEVSFTTYNYRPSHSDFHITGTLPDTMVDSSQSSAEYNYYLFDNVNEVESAIDPHPAAEILVGLGFEALEGFWAKAISLGSGTERSLEDWYPIVLLCVLDEPSIRDRVQLDRVEASRALRWLSEAAGRLSAEVVQDYGLLLDSLGTLTTDDQLDLLQVARAAGLPELQASCETTLVRADIDDLKGGGNGDERDYEPASDMAKREVAAFLHRAIHELEPSHKAANQIYRVYRWSKIRGVGISPSLQTECAARHIAPLVIEGSLDESYLQLDRGRPFQQGVLDALRDSYRAHPERVRAAFDRGITSYLDQDLFVDDPDLAELTDLVLAQSDQGERPEAYLRAVRRREHMGDQKLLLSEFWPDPAPTEVLWLMSQQLPAVESSALLKGAEGFVLGPRFDGAKIDFFRKIPNSYAARLSAKARKVREDALDVADVMAGLAEVNDSRRGPNHEQVLRALTISKRCPPGLEGRLRSRILESIDLLPDSDIASVLPQAPPKIREGLMKSWDSRLAEEDAKFGVRLIDVAEELGTRKKLSQEIVQMVISRSQGWSRRKQKRVAQRLNPDEDGGSFRSKLTLRRGSE